MYFLYLKAFHIIGVIVWFAGLFYLGRLFVYHQEAKSHNSVAAAIAQKRAEWGIAIRSVAEDLGLGFFPIQDEEYDFILPKNRLERPEVIQFLSLLEEKKTQKNLIKLGLKTQR